MNTDGQIDYSAVLQDLENDRTELESLIAYIKRKKLGQNGDSKITPGAGAMGTTSSRANLMTGTAIAPDAFFGLNLVEGAQKYLAMVRTPKTAREIADALKDGGYKTTSKAFNNTVFTVLDRVDKNEGAIAKVNKAFGLAAWYPGLKRTKSTKTVPEQIDLPKDGQEEFENIT